MVMKNLLGITLFFLTLTQASALGPKLAYGSVFSVDGSFEKSPHFPIMSEEEYHSYLTTSAEDIVHTFCQKDQFEHAELNSSEATAYTKKLEAERVVCSEIRTMKLKTLEDKKDVIAKYSVFNCEHLYSESGQLKELDKSSKGMSKKSCMDGPVALTSKELISISQSSKNIAIFNPIDESLKGEDFGVTRLPASQNKEE